MDIVAPRLNANEDQVEVAQVFVNQGAMVQKGALLFVLETTKAAVEILSPATGTVFNLAAGPGEMVDVGFILCQIKECELNHSETESEKSLISSSNSRNLSKKEIKVTLKARLRAGELGIDIGDVPPKGDKIGVAEVEEFAAASVTRKIPLRAPNIGGGRAVLVGAGGHAAMIADMLAHSGYRLVGCTDPALPIGSEVLGGLRVIGTDEILGTLKADGINIAFIGVGGATDNRLRQRIYETLIQVGFSLPSLIHTSAYVGMNTEVGNATYVLPGAVVGPRCLLGDNVIVNCTSHIAHDSVVESHAHLAPGSTVAGQCKIGEGATLGMCATVLYGCSIGRNCLIHNNAAVIGNIPDNIELSVDGRWIPH